MSWSSTRLSTKSAKRQQVRKQMKLINEINLAPRISRRGQISQNFDSKIGGNKVNNLGI